FPTFPEARRRPGYYLARRVTRAARGMLRGVGVRGYYARDVGRALSEPHTWLAETVRQMRGMGVDSLPLVVVVAGFLGGATAFQSYYQLFAGVQLSVLGLLVRGSIEQAEHGELHAGEEQLSVLGLTCSACSCAAASCSSSGRSSRR